MPIQPDEITRLYRSCDPFLSIQPDDERWVDFDDVRGGGYVQTYMNSIVRADPERPVAKLFSGHRGAGKTTELYRLRDALEKKRFKVIYMDVMGGEPGGADPGFKLDPNDTDFTDLLVFIAATIQSKLKAMDIAGFDPVTIKFENFWKGFKESLPTDFELSQGEIGIGLGKIVAEIHNQPSARKKLRREIEKRSTSLLEAVNDVLELARVKLREHSFEDLVLLVDGLDKVELRPLEGGVNTHERLFVFQAEQFNKLKAPVVFTVPISLDYSPRAAGLTNATGDTMRPMPMIRIRGDGRSEPTADTPGMKKMREMIEKRCAHAKVAFGEVFDSNATCTTLCKMSGGDPRHLMMLIRAACDLLDGLPITEDAAAKAIQNYGNSLLREVPDEYWEKLKKYGEPQTDIDKDQDHDRMLFYLWILEYMNATPWYEVNPVIRTLHRFQK